MDEQVITVFKKLRDTKNPYYTTVGVALDRIRTGNSSEKVSLIRTMTDKKERDEIKESLPSYCFSGKFSNRSNEALINHSGVVIVDFDHLDNPDEFKESITKDEFIYFAFISPSGDGLKVGIKIPPDKKTHEASCRAITEYFKDEKLDEFTDVSRVCYESYDEKLYHNPQSKIFEKLKKIETNVKPFHVPDIHTDYDKIYEKLKTWLQSKGENYADGNKHKYLVKLAGACLRFGIPSDITLQKLLFDFINAAGKVNPKDYERIVNRTYSLYSSRFNTAFFEKEPDRQQKEEIFDTTLPLQDVIIVKDIAESMIEGFDKGYEKGTTTYFPNIDNHWTWRKKEVTLFHGIPNHGKSAMVLQLALIKSVREGTKWGVFSPENNPPNFFYDELIRVYIGKNTMKSQNQMSLKEYKKGMDFVGEHFFYIYPKDNMPTPEYINERFYSLIVKHKIEGCIIDPFNQLTNAWAKAGRDDLYMDSFLSAEIRFAQKHDVYKIIIAHPRGSIRALDSGYYRMPHPYDLAHGAMWFNMCDNIICIHRPELPVNKQSTEVQFVSQKIKRTRLVGFLGETNMFFDIATGRYMYDGQTPFENKQMEIVEFKENNYITPNIDEPPF